MVWEIDLNFLGTSDSDICLLSSLGAADGRVT